MKKRALCLGLALCMALTGCGPKAAQVTPTPQPSATLEPTVPTSEPTTSPEPTETPEPSVTVEPTGDPAPDPQDDPKGYILSWVDKMLDGEKIFLRFWIHPGSGPTPSDWSTAENGVAVRKMFEDLDWDGAKLLTWEEVEALDETWVNAPGAYSVSLDVDDDGYINCGLNRGMIRVSREDGEHYIRVDGAEKLCEKLTDMVPSVYINLGRVRVPPQKTKEATIKLYVETALERLKENGHITDYILRVCEPVVFEDNRYWVLPKEEEPAWETHPSIAYTIAYAVKPAHPELSFWTDLDEDGWQNVDWRDVEGDYWEGIDYDERDGCYGMS